jgi:hypothetical protein
MLTMPNQKKGFFSGLFSKKQKTQLKQTEQSVNYQSPSTELPSQPLINTNMTQTPTQNMTLS